MDPIFYIRMKTLDTNVLKYVLERNSNSDLRSPIVGPLAFLWERGWKSLSPKETSSGFPTLIGYSNSYFALLILQMWGSIELGCQSQICVCRLVDLFTYYKMFTSFSSPEKNTEVCFTIKLKLSNHIQTKPVANYSNRSITCRAKSITCSIISVQ